MPDLTDDELLNFDLYAGDRDDAGARCQSSRIVTTCKPHVCRFSGQAHDIPVGSRARLEKACLDGTWGQFYVCCACLIAFIEEHDA